MDQKEIKKILDEAAKSGHIQRIFSSLHREIYNKDDLYRGFRVVFEELFVKTLQNKPQHLPNLFPLFALLCGDREESMPIANIHWDLV